MRILRNYILKECVTPFAICLGVLTFVFLLGYLPQLANKVINQGVDIGSVALAFIYNIPVLLGYTLPVASLAAIILTFGRFSSDNEIIAIRASGISLRSLLWPLIAITSQDNMTLQLGLSSFVGSHTTNWPVLMAGTVMTQVPMLLIFLVAQRWFVQSFASSGVKG